METKIQETINPTYLGCSTEFFKKWIQYQRERREYINYELLGLRIIVSHELEHILEMPDEQQIYWNWINFRPVSAQRGQGPGKKYDHNRLDSFHSQILKAYDFINQYYFLNEEEKCEIFTNYSFIYNVFCNILLSKIPNN